MWSVWDAPRNARYEPLDQLPATPPTPERVAELQEQVREETEERARPYRVGVSIERFRAEPSAVAELALQHEVAVLGPDGEPRLLIARTLEPLA